MKRNIFFPVFILIALFPFISFPSDWPIYKGNIYFTGNNDEITVKNNNLKWLFQAEHLVYNPIVSDGRVYFLDMKKNIYCLDEDSGRLLWKVDINKYSSQFAAYSKAMGKVKYPLIKGDLLILTDNIAIYCLNKKTGYVLWARTGMRDEKNLDSMSKWNEGGTGRQHSGRSKWEPAKSSHAIVDSIYSDPLIHEDRIYYGTRNVFISREIYNGHLKWNNDTIKSYSGFPSFYDSYIFTQSMDYGKNNFTLNCLDSGTGKTLWSNRIVSPMKIFSPVVYAGKVFLASNKTLYSYDLKSGNPVWEKDYNDFITSNPSFTEREIVFSVGNKDIVAVNPENGSIARSMDMGKKSSPYFVIIRDRVYIAGTFEKEIGKKMTPFGILKSLGLNDKAVSWEFTAPFPGGSSQPSASKGIMFLPAGNYLYAVGTDYYPSIVRGGSSIYDPYNSIDPGIPPDEKMLKEKKSDSKSEKADNKEDPDWKGDNTRKMNVTIKGEDGKDLKAEAEIKKWDRGKVTYSKKTQVSKPNQEIDVPDSDDVEITVNAPGYAPKKVIVSRNDKSRDITLDKIEKGKGIVMDNIYFEFDQAHLKKESLNILDAMTSLLKRDGNIKLEVRGHTDSTGPRDYNLKLSEKRSDSVVDYMIKNGISPERLKSAGLGPDKPIADNKTVDGRKKNRRTEFYILER